MSDRVRLRNHKTAVAEPGVLTESMLVMSAATGVPSVESLVLWSVNRTSLDRTGCPSCHFARGLMWHAMLSESGLHVQRSAKHGVKPASPTTLSESPMSANLSYTRSTIC